MPLGSIERAERHKLYALCFKHRLYQEKYTRYWHDTATYWHCPNARNAIDIGYRLTYTDIADAVHCASLKEERIRVFESVSNMKKGTKLLVLVLAIVMLATSVYMTAAADNSITAHPCQFLHLHQWHSRRI